MHESQRRDPQRRDTQRRDTQRRDAGVPTRWLRNSRGAPRWGLLIGVAVVVLAVGLAAGLWGTSNGSKNASAQPFQRPRPAANDLTQGWTLYNHSNSTLVYQGYDGGTLEGGGPKVPTDIAPGGALHFEQVFYFAQETTSALNFASESPNKGDFAFIISIDGINQASASVAQNYSSFHVSVDAGSRALNVGD